MIETIGGLGLFLLGMIIMTDGLRALAGHAIRNALMRFTRTPLSGAITGSITTAILQSSSATTVAAIGFVGAGLMTFPSALGIIFGANIGTTITGWFVVLLGFKFKLDIILLPLIFIGASLKLFGNHRISKAGYTLAGFGLIFVGISYMQEGMSAYQDILSSQTFATDTIQNQLQLVMIGMIFTIITQSSSAGIAITVTALFSSAIYFEQAALLVIGMDVGTTVTAVIATIGGSAEARRTGYSHVLYNLFAATGAFFLLTPYMYLWDFLSAGSLNQHAEVALVAFHTAFNTLGVLIALPFTKHIAGFMQHIIPEQRPLYTKNLDSSLLNDPAVAIAATQSTVHKIMIDLLNYINRLLEDSHSKNELDLYMIKRALDDTHDYISNIQLGEEKITERETLISIIHSLDHLQRLHKRCTENERTQTILEYRELEIDRRKILISNKEIIQEIENKNWREVNKLASEFNQKIEGQMSPLRKTIMKDVATKKIDSSLANDYLEAVRWLDRVSDHIDRIAYYLSIETIDKH